MPPVAIINYKSERCPLALDFQKKSVIIPKKRRPVPRRIMQGEGPHTKSTVTCPPFVLSRNRSSYRRRDPTAGVQLDRPSADSGEQRTDLQSISLKRHAAVRVSVLQIYVCEY